jgi:glycerol dehydrogenase-like iron-containing ADH family enzyme
MQQVETVKTQLGRETAVVSVGSGVVTDISKHACYLFEGETGVHIPFIVYQTANSVSAYTSNGAPLFVQGVKRTFHCIPAGCDLETLRGAPRMAIAGGRPAGDLRQPAGLVPAPELGVDPN